MADPTPSQAPRVELPRDLGALTPPEMVQAVQRYFFSTNPETGRLVRSVEEAQSLGLEAVEPVDGDVPWVFPNNTTPENVQVLLRFLEELTNAVDVRVSQVTFSDLLGVSDGPRVRKDFEHWRVRLNSYKTSTATAMGLPKKEGSQFEGFFATAVVNPLLRGWYPGQEAQGIADFVTPLIIARTMEANENALQFAWEQLRQDLIDRTRFVVGAGLAIAVPVAIAAVLVAAWSYGASKAA